MWHVRDGRSFDFARWKNRSAHKFERIDLYVWIQTHTGKALLKGTLAEGRPWETPTGAPDAKRRPAKRIIWDERAKENILMRARKIDYWLYVVARFAVKVDDAWTNVRMIFDNAKDETKGEYLRGVRLNLFPFDYE